MGDGCDVWCVMCDGRNVPAYWLLLTGCCGLRRFLFLFHSPLKLNKTPPWFVYVDGKSVIGRSHCRAERNDDPGTDRMKTERRGIFGRQGTCCILVAPHYYHHVLRRGVCASQPIGAESVRDWLLLIEHGIYPEFLGYMTRWIQDTSTL